MSWSLMFVPIFLSYLSNRRPRKKMNDSVQKLDWKIASEPKTGIIIPLQWTPSLYWTWSLSIVTLSMNCSRSGSPYSVRRALNSSLVLGSHKSSLICIAVNLSIRSWQYLFVICSMFEQLKQDRIFFRSLKPYFLSYSNAVTRFSNFTDSSDD